MKKPASARRTTGKKIDSWRALMAEARRFRDARDWSQFHTPKNLAVEVHHLGGTRPLEIR